MKNKFTHFKIIKRANPVSGTVFLILFILFPGLLFSQNVIIPAANTNDGAARYPMSTYYGFQRSAMVYTPTQVGTSGTITHVGFYLNSTSSPGASPVRIYLKMRGNIMPNNSTWAVETTDATLVFDGTVAAASFVTNNWVTIELDTPFSYTGGTNNLQVLVETNAGGTGNEVGLGKQFRYTTLTGTNSDRYFKYWENDIFAPIGNGTRSANRPNIKLTFNNCKAPVGLDSNSVTSNSANITWSAATPPPANGYDYYLSTSNTVPTGSTTPTGSVMAGTTAVNLSSLLDNTTYYFWVRSKCDLNSPWSVAGTFTTLLAPCSGTPLGGTASITPASGNTSSAFLASVSGGTTNVSGLIYQWQISDTGTAAGPWTDIPGATGAAANLTAVTVPDITKYYRRKIICSVSGAEAYSTVASFKTNAVTYCTARTTSRENYLYINNVSFVGTLADWTKNSTSVSNGYNNFTTDGPAIQADGAVVNINATSTGTALSRGTWKAWVDWNGDGDFSDANELVYSNYGYLSGNVSFGFIIPAGQAPGNYRLRIRVNNSLSFGNENYGFNFGPCDDFTSLNNNNGQFGETEDYTIRVIYNCPAKITAINVSPGDGQRCGTGKVTLSAAGTGTSYKWYTVATGGTAISGASSNTYETPSISTSRYYYVTAVSAGGCETVYRTPVYASINPAPEVTFTSSAVSICGNESASISLTSSGDKREATLLEEDFNSVSPNGLGQFSTQIAGGYTNTIGDWNNIASPTIPGNPPYASYSPALSSGYTGGNFAGIITAINRTQPILNHLVLRDNFDTTGYLNLRMDFDLYYYSSTTNAANAYLKIDYSVNGGSTWTNLTTVTNDTGNPGFFEKQSIMLPSGALNKTQFKVRFSVFSDNVAGGGWHKNAATVDNIRIYGEKPVTAAFSWSGATSVLFEADCITPLGSTLANGVCLKPSAAQIESDQSWTVTATASFNNGCPATKSITINNDTKTWNPATATNWTDARWAPSTSVPDATKCVVVKKPVTIGASTDALAKNITIEPNGKLTVSGSLLVNDAVNNTTGDARNLVVKNDGNLKQIEPVVNTTPIAARRIHSLTDNRKEYNYLSSPVKDQDMKMIFGDNRTYVPFVTVLNEPTNYFVNAKAFDYTIAARGFAVREPKTDYTGVTIAGAGNSILANEAEYKGIPNNGNVSIPLQWTSAVRGYNVVGNPYPSNIDIVQLYVNSVTNFANPEIDANFRFWDNKVNATYTQMGGSYQGYSYGIYNAISQASTAAPGLDPNHAGGGVTTLKAPGRIAKVSQAFMVRALQGGASMNFNNTMRSVTNAESTFFGKNAGHNRYRLQLSTADSFVVQNAVTYFAEGNNAFGFEDAEIPNAAASDALYTYAGNKKVVINGRSMFSEEDIVRLGSRHFTAGTYRIEAVDKEGIFENGQNIYLKDKQLNILANLSEGVYTFSSESGEFNNRFEIVYRPEVILATDQIDKKKIEVFRDAADFVVKTSGRNIESVEVYDGAGRMLLKVSGRSGELRFSSAILVDGIYVVKAVLSDGETITQKIRK